MAWRACLRCGSTDLAQPGALEGVLPEGASWLCRRCGLEGVPMTFADAGSLAQFQAQREVLYKPSPADVPPLALERPAKPRSPWVRGVAGIIGFGLVLMGFLMFASAAQLGGSAWATIGLQGIVALLLGAPFVAIAARG